MPAWPAFYTPVRIVFEWTEDGFTRDGVLVLETDIEAANRVTTCSMESRYLNIWPNRKGY